MNSRVYILCAWLAVLVAAPDLLTAAPRFSNEATCITTAKKLTPPTGSGVRGNDVPQTTLPERVVWIDDATRITGPHRRAAAIERNRTGRARLKKLSEKYAIELSEDGTLPKPYASGGDGNIYLGRKGGKTIAIKIPHEGVDPRRFINEAEFANTAAAGGVPRIATLEYDDENHVHVMSFFPTTLQERIGDFHVTDVATAVRALDILAKLGSSVAGMHGNGVIHRDLKPLNIMLDQRGDPWVIDFSLAAAPKQHVPGLPRDAISGTPSHMSPKQLTSGETADPAQDGFALGIVAWEVITGQLVIAPKSESSVEVTASGDAAAVPRPAKSLGAIQNLPQYLKPVSAISMFRPENAQDFNEALAAAQKVVEAQSDLEWFRESILRRSASDISAGRVRVVHRARRVLGNWSPSVRRELTLLESRVEAEIERFYRSEAVQRQIEVLIREFPENLRNAPDLLERLSPEQRSRLGL